MGYQLAHVVILVERFDLLDLSKGVKGLIVQIVHILHVAVRDDNVWQLLHVTDTMCYPSKMSQLLAQPSYYTARKDEE